MDGRRFDDLTRAVAGGRSRRIVVRGLVGGALAAIGLRGRITAQTTVAIGGQCSVAGANAECSQVGTPTGGVPVICSDNGISRDGAFNCCRNAGGVCTADFHCCGAALCINGICSGGGTSGLPLGSSCTTSGQCSQTGGAVVCADNGLLRDGTTNCCRNQGGACSEDANCCAALLCANNVCGGTTTTPPSSNLGLGATCTATSQCSQTGGAVVCADNGVAADGALNCCRNAGGTCANSAACCGGLDCTNGTCARAPATGAAPGASCTDVSQCSQAGGAVACASNGIADDGALNCCRNAGGACTGVDNSADCCGGLYCREGVCTDLSVSGELPPGSFCTSSSQCTQVGGTTVCADNGITDDGTLNCCRNAGGACSGSVGCCAGQICTNGVCGGGGTSPGTALPLGSTCTTSSQCSQTGGTVVCADNGLSPDGSLNCCRNAGGACTTANNSASCCGGLLCVSGACQ